MKIGIYIGDQVFSADFYDNEAAKKIMNLFPLNLHTEQTTLNSKDFFAPLERKIEVSEKAVSNAVIGDIALCNSISISLFVKARKVNSKYINLGHISDPYELQEALVKNKGYVRFDYLPSTFEAIA